MSKGSVLSAEKNLQQTNTKMLPVVQNNVLLSSEKITGIKVKSVKYIGKQDVYNMEVAKHHNFSVNGGLIVHNCIDSLRYALSVEMGIVRNMDNDGKPQFALSGGSPIADYKNASNSNSGLSFSRPNNYNPLRR